MSTARRACRAVSAAPSRGRVQARRRGRSCSPSSSRSPSRPGQRTITTEFGACVGQAARWRQPQLSLPAAASGPLVRALSARARPGVRDPADRAAPGEQVPARAVPLSRRGDRRVDDAPRGALRPPLRAATFETLIGLLACTGLRIGEALRLDRDDFDPTRGLLTVRDSKFGKSREVLLHPSTVQALDRLWRDPRPALPAPAATRSFFVTTRGTRPAHPTIYQPFHSAARPSRRARTPRPASGSSVHDLRHSFAVKTLLGWYRDGGDVAARMPLLSTYLGHVDPGRDVLVPVRSAGAARAWPPSVSSGRRDGHDRARADARGVLHQPADQRERRQPAHDRRLPRHLPAAALIRATAHRQAAIEARRSRISTRR